MKTRCPNTILLVTRDRLVRADLRAGRGKIAVTALYEQRRVAADDLPSQVEAALRQSSKGPGQVWILTSEIWTQSLSLPLESLTGLSTDEVTRALGFEAEPFSNLGAMEAAIASVPETGDGRTKTFWLSEMPNSQLEQIDFVIRQAAGRLAGVSHPGGLPAPFDATLADSSWRRIELWPAAMISVEGKPGAVAKVAVVNSDPRPGRWLNDVPSLAQDSATTTEWLHATSALPVEEIPESGCWSLEDRTALEHFLVTWAEQLAASRANVPQIVPLKRPMSTGVRQAIAAVVGVAALVACVAVQVFVNQHHGYLANETGRLKAATAQVAKLKGDNDKLQTQRDELKKACGQIQADLDHYQEVMRAQRQRLLSLLTVLAHRSTDDVMIRKIEGTENEIVLHGLCMQTEFADNLAGALAAALKHEGWNVQPPSRQSKEMLVGGGPWEFEVHIEDPLAKSPPPAAAQRAGGK